MGGVGYNIRRVDESGAWSRSDFQVVEVILDSSSAGNEWSCRSQIVSAMAGSLRVSWRSVHWIRPLFYGAGIGTVGGLLVGSAAFRWGPLSPIGKAFVAFLTQPPLVGLMLVGVTLLAGLLLGSRRPVHGWVEGLLFVGAYLGSGFLLGGLVRLLAGSLTPANVAEMYDSAAHAFVRIWLMMSAELLLWGSAGLAVGMVLYGLRRGRFQTSLVGAIIAILGFASAILVQSHLVQFAFPEGI